MTNEPLKFFYRNWFRDRLSVPSEGRFSQGRFSEKRALRARGVLSKQIGNAVRVLRVCSGNAPGVHRGVLHGDSECSGSILKADWVL